MMSLPWVEQALVLLGDPLTTLADMSVLALLDLTHTSLAALIVLDMLIVVTPMGQRNTPIPALTLTPLLIRTVPTMDPIDVTITLSTVTMSMDHRLDPMDINRPTDHNPTANHPIDQLNLR